MRTKLKNNQAKGSKVLYTIEDHPNPSNLSANQTVLKGAITTQSQEVIYTPGKIK